MHYHRIFITGGRRFSGIPFFISWFGVLLGLLGTFRIKANAETEALQPPAGMASIPSGDYTPLYVKDSTKRHVGEFHLDVKAVSNAEFLQFVATHPKWRRSQVPRAFADSGYLKHWAGDLDLGPDAENLQDSPVTSVSWFAARAFLQSRGKRLPREDEWEYAGRASKTKADASNDPDFTRQLLDWYSRPGASIPKPAAEANVYGVRGLHGIIWEWVDDFNNAMDTGESRSGGDLERDLFCGAGALETPDPTRYAAFMRFAFRSSLRASYTTGSLGFRGAWSPGTVAAAVPIREAFPAAPLPPESIYHIASIWRNQRNETIPLGSLGSHIQVLCMGFTSCAYACPRITADMRAIERALDPELRRSVQFTFVSIDPDRDTPAALAAHAKESHLEHWNFLTSTPGSVLELAAMLGFKYQKVEQDFAHSNTIYIIDRDGIIANRQESLGGDSAAPLAAIRKSAGSSASR
ncbi:MAG: SUMF1/EgtB/PvdO family nonheme iron enzyme [Verrucomicrobiales bacterium]